MNKSELIKLIDDIILASLRYDLAKETLKKIEIEYESVLVDFNTKIESIKDVNDEMFSDEELSYKLMLANKIFEVLEKFSL